MRVTYTAEARAEFDEILSYINADSPEAAVVVGRAITSAVKRLRTFPHIGAATDEPEVRVIMARPYRYLIFYRLERDTVVIRNIRHPARRRPA